MRELEVFDDCALTEKVTTCEEQILRSRWVIGMEGECGNEPSES